MTSYIFLNHKDKPYENRNSNEKFYCCDCFAYEETDCFCSKIVGYDAETGYPIVDVTDVEWNYLYGQGDENQDAEKTCQ